MILDNFKTRVLYIIPLLCFWGSVSAQYYLAHYTSRDTYKIIDSAYLEFTYKLTYLKDSLSDKYYQDIHILQIGTTFSRYYSHFNMDYHRNIEKFEAKGKDAYYGNPEGGSWSQEVYKNLTDRKVEVTDIGIFAIRENYIYKEELDEVEWLLTDETEEILSYTCLKATGCFRGRRYIAWFTMEIPMSNGPWKFGGLPGMILKVSDLSRHYIFECISVEQLAEKEPLLFFQLPYQNIKRKELDKLYRRYNNDQAAFNALNGVMTLEINQAGERKIVQNSSYKIPYNPLELE